MDWLIDWLIDWLSDWLIGWFDWFDCFDCFDLIWFDLIWFDWLIDWLIWLIDWLIDCLVGWLVGWLIGWLIWFWFGFDLIWFDWIGLIDWLVDWLIVLIWFDLIDLIDLIVLIVLIWFDLVWFELIDWLIDGWMDGWMHGLIDWLIGDDDDTVVVALLGSGQTPGICLYIYAYILYICRQIMIVHFEHGSCNQSPLIWQGLLTAQGITSFLHPSHRWYARHGALVHLKWLVWITERWLGGLCAQVGTSKWCLLVFFSNVYRLGIRHTSRWLANWSREIQAISLN